MAVAAGDRSGSSEVQSAARIIFGKTLRNELDSVVLVVKHGQSQLIGALTMLSVSSEDALLSPLP